MQVLIKTKCEKFQGCVSSVSTTLCSFPSGGMIESWLRVLFDDAAKNHLKNIIPSVHKMDYIGQHEVMITLH